MPSQKAKEKQVAEPEGERLENGDSRDSGSDFSEEEKEATSSTLPEASMPSTSSKKKKKKRSKAIKALNALRSGHKDEVPNSLVNAVVQKMHEEGGEEMASMDVATIRQALEQMKIRDMIQGKAGIGGKNKKDTGGHKFWATQPVPQLGEVPSESDGYIEPSKPPEEIRQDPYPLPKDFEWATLDINDLAQLREVYELLSANYVEDDEASFRFQYSAEFLRWALKPPGSYKEWHVGVRVASNKKLVAFISAVPISLRVRENTLKASEVNFLCVHKKLRSKRLAPVLIKEITRQCHLKGIFQALYTGGVFLPTPVSTCQYHHRCLNVKKLVDVHFTTVPPTMTLARMLRLHKVPDTPRLLSSGLREMEERDIPQVTELYAKYMSRFGMVHLMTEEEIGHLFLSGRGEGSTHPDSWKAPREAQVVWAYVVEDPETRTITDYFSFYSLPSTVMNSDKHNLLKAAYLFYYGTNVAFSKGADQDGRLKRRLEELIGDCMIIASQADFDVVNALTIMDNVMFLQDHKFGKGDGLLNYYLYNWRTSPLAGISPVDGVPAGRGIGVGML
ncbi:N-myristoyl transferase [Laetiporus sulphureus 93-53]|uniref:Glycylpeptide N-tetradecanoyltransferase n=1 Tax=Laetiporus sulphureus 93-53 TaxID=1314785 RepID=A0A165G0M3_9APHY|nr:N-myristoyl transferase [Laetiporus sulphureus 93-53]KZT09671.1 N-myristoyl transferase [Laetiporus sulphureus 93-53]